MKWRNIGILNELSSAALDAGVAEQLRIESSIGRFLSEQEEAE